MNMLSLDLSDPEIAEQLTECVVGEPKRLTLVVTPTKIEEGVKFEATVDSVEYAEPVEDEEDAEDEEEAPAPMKDKMAPAIAIVMGAKKAK